MTKVAIHQPNYQPWLGYFRKMARAEIFVFLDDVQFSKQNYINRVRILAPGGPRWLTVPVSVRLGQSISEVRPARPDWVRTHLDVLRTCYRSANSFRSVWPEVRLLYAAAPDADLATVNRVLLGAMAQRLDINARLVLSSDLSLGDPSGDDRLIAIVDSLAPGGTYLSGKGGDKYQSAEKFGAAGLGLEYVDHDIPAYDQGNEEHHPGLSILDALFHLGWERVAALVHARP